MTDDARRLTTVAATALVVANMIGTGIFVMTGLLAGMLGSPWVVLAVWCVAGLLALCGAAIYGELGAMMPRAGGEYVYLSRAFHPAVGFLSGWVSLLVGFSAPVAASAYAFGLYAHAVVPGLPVQAAAVVAIAVLSLLHMVDVGLGARVLTALAVFKVTLIAVFVVAAFTIGEGDWSHLSAPSSELTSGSLAVSLVLASFAYSGWNAAAYVAGELRDPERGLPRALLGGTAIVLALYLALNVAFFYGAPSDVLAGAEDVGAVSAAALFGSSGGKVFAGLISLALLSSVSAMVMAGPRVYMAMAEDGLFFSLFARRTRSGAPAASIALQGTLAMVMAVTATFEELLTYIGFTLSVFAALTVVAAFVLRRREPAAVRPYRTFGWPITPVLFLALAGWMVVFSVSARPAVSLAGGATLVAGGLFYLVWRRR